MTLLRAILIFIAAALAAWAVVWLADNPGWFAAQWFGYRLEGPMSILAAFAVAGFALLYVLVRLIILVLTSPAVGRRFFARRRAEAGKGALTEGLAAAAAGDAGGAHRAAARAGRLVREDPLAQVLALEAAELEARDEDVVRLAQGLTAHDETELLGRRALFDVARRVGDTTRALKEAESAFARFPAAGWAAKHLLAHAIRTSDWDRALSVVTLGERHGAFQPSGAGPIRGAVLMAQAQKENTGDGAARAVGLARKALGADPQLTPAAILVAEHLAATGRDKRAAEWAASHWQALAHPILGAIYADAGGEATGEQLFERVRTLAEKSPGHVESRLLFADYAARARHTAAAREALRLLIDGDLSSRAYVVMAAIERVEHGAAARPERWIDEALAAPRDGLWVCTTCGHRHRQWHAICGGCTDVGSMRWATHVMASDPLPGNLPQVSALNLPPPDPEPSADDDASVESGDHAGQATVEPLRQPDDPGTDQTQPGKKEASW